MTTAADVAEYLKGNPEFFEQYADLLAELYIPHPHGGRAIPIAERQILTLRDKNRLLEAKLGELLQFGEENDSISEKVHRLSLSLNLARDLESLVNTFYFNLLEDFAVPHVAIRVWLERHETPEMPEFEGVEPEIRQLAEQLHHPYCGNHVPASVLGWFGEAGARLKSFAQVALRTDTTCGLLVMASEDPQRFYPEMGTLYLGRLGDLVSAAIVRNLPEA